jgi:5-methylcytosine-specific restriction protein A
MAWHRTSRQSRGYDAQWERVRAEVLRWDNGLCQCSRCKGGELRLTIATEVHHVKSKAECRRLGWTRAQTDHPSNLASMSHECHVRADAEAAGRTHREKIQFTADGWPIWSAALPGGDRKRFDRLPARTATPLSVKKIRKF